MRVLVVGALALLGCRAHFDRLDPGDAAPTDAAFDAAVDTPPGSVLATFGETPDATYKNVTADTYVNGDVALVDERLNNFGAAEELRIRTNGPERALLRFDVSAIPPTATILDARLRVTVIDVPLDIGAIRVHPLLEDWTEGTFDGSPGVASFTMRVAGQQWTTPGAAMPGSAAPEIAAFTPSALGSVTVVLPPQTVAGWLAGPNHGLMLQATSDDRTELASSEAVPASARPLLFVTYVP